MSDNKQYIYQPIVLFKYSLVVYELIIYAEHLSTNLLNQFIVQIGG